VGAVPCPASASGAGNFREHDALRAAFAVPYIDPDKTRIRPGATDSRLSEARVHPMAGMKRPSTKTTSRPWRSRRLAAMAAR
jgi:hypothetical protein